MCCQLTQCIFISCCSNCGVAAGAPQAGAGQMTPVLRPSPIGWLPSNCHLSRVWHSAATPLKSGLLSDNCRRAMRPYSATTPLRRVPGLVGTPLRRVSGSTSIRRLQGVFENSRQRRKCAHYRGRGDPRPGSVRRPGAAADTTQTR